MKGSVHKMAMEAAKRKLSARAIRRKVLAYAKKHGSNK